MSDAARCSYVLGALWLLGLAAFAPASVASDAPDPEIARKLMQKKLSMPGIPSRISHPVTGPLSPAPSDPKNLRGTWITDFAAQLQRTVDGKQLPYTPAALATVMQRVQRDAAGAPVPESNVFCQPRGVVRVMNAVMALRIVQTEDRVTILAQEDHEVRTIRLDAKHPPHLRSTYMGDSIGHWEGDVLVVDTVGFNGKTWLDTAGSPLSDRLHVVERIRRTATGLENLMTIEDPVNYTAAFTLRLTYEWRPDLGKFFEIICEENPRSRAVNGVVVDE